MPYDSAYGDLLDAKQGAQLLLRVVTGGVQPPDHGNVEFGELGVAVGPPSLVLAPAADNLIADVVGVGSQVEMTGVAAGRVIAVMQNVKSRGDRADAQFIAEAMGALHRGSAVHPKEAIALAVSTGQPRPTGFFTGGAVDLGPKAFHIPVFVPAPVTSSQEY